MLTALQPVPKTRELRSEESEPCRTRPWLPEFPIVQLSKCMSDTFVAETAVPLVKPKRIPLKLTCDTSRTMKDEFATEMNASPRKSPPAGPGGMKYSKLDSLSM